MGVARYGERFIRRRDPRGRIYYWATSDPPPKPEDSETDLTALANGYVTLTALDFDLTKQSVQQQMEGWALTLRDPG
jgi:5'-nucleotidase